MITRLEVSTKVGMANPAGENIRHRIANELDISLESVEAVDVYKIDADLTEEQLGLLKKELFTDPISHESSFGVLPPIVNLEETLTVEKGKRRQWLPALYDKIIEISWKPGVTDNAARITAEAMHDLGIELKPGEDVYTSTEFRIKGKQGVHFDPQVISSDLLANEIIQSWDIKDYAEWCRMGPSKEVPKAEIKDTPIVKTIDLAQSIDDLIELSSKKEWGFNQKELESITGYYNTEEVIEKRKQAGLTEKPTDAEIESIAQTWSEHCKHKQFNALIHYTGPDKETNDINSIFQTYIKDATEEIRKTKPWIKSVFWDNAGVIEFNKDWLFCLKCETHNSPSNMEGYGGAITGIVGVYRDPMGTGMGAKLIFGYYGFIVGPQDYDGTLRPPQHPKVLLERVRKGVEDGGNKHGVPTPYGKVFFDKSYLGKCIIPVAAGGMIPAEVNGKPGWEKEVNPGDLIIMAGGRVGIDGVHGATASSREFDENTPAGHVQIGDPYMQKKLLDLQLEALELGLYRFVQDNGAGGLNSSVGETASYCGEKGGCVLDLDKVPLKYANPQPWEILISESQERMTYAVSPEKINKFMELAKKHGVEATVLGEFNDTGIFNVKYGGKTIVNLDMEFLHEGVPQMELTAEWNPPETYEEPELPENADLTKTLLDILSRPNICSKEYIARQFDHEVQGGSVIKPMVGVDSDVESDASVLRPLLDSHEGIAIAAGLNPHYSKIDTYHMSAMAIDEGIRRIIAVGGSLDKLILNDNFNWPNSLEDKHKLAQLVRANQALYDYTIAFGVPCISGKDSMSIDGTIKDKQGHSERISGIPLVQYLAAGKIEDVRKCITMDAKFSGDLVYAVGLTKNELGASEYYEMLGEVGCNVPKVDAEKAKATYTALHDCVEKEIIASMHGCYKGGLAVALAQTAFAGKFGMNIDLRKLPVEGIVRDDTALFSESASRLVVTIDPNNKEEFEKTLNEYNINYGCVGEITNQKEFSITGLDGSDAGSVASTALKNNWKKPMDW